MTASMSTSDAYAILGLPFGSPADELKKAYRTLVLRWHPDHNESCPKAMIMTQSLNEARETLLLSGLGERLHAALLRQREEAARKKQEEEAKARLLRQQQEREAKAKRRAEEEEAWRRLPELQAELARTRDELARSNKRFADLEAARRPYVENLSNALLDKNAEAAKATKEAASARKVPTVPSQLPIAAPRRAAPRMCAIYPLSVVMPCCCGQEAAGWLRTVMHMKAAYRKRLVALRAEVAALSRREP